MGASAQSLSVSREERLVTRERDSTLWSQPMGSTGDQCRARSMLAWSRIVSNKLQAA